MKTKILLSAEIIQWAIGHSDRTAEEIYTRYPTLKTDTPQFTVKQLEELAKYVRVPFVNLLLGTIPPDEPLPIPDFRTKSDKTISKPSLNLRDIIWTMEKRQDWMHEYLQSQQAQPLPFIGELKRVKNPELAAQRIRNYLGIDTTWQEELSSSDNPLKYFREKIEDIGVMVFLESGLDTSSRHRFDPQEFRGFVLQDSIAPLLFINSADSVTAQLFTLIHEFVHLCRGDSGLVDFDSQDSKEKFCNQTTAELLVPQKRFVSQWEEYQADIEQLAKNFRVSSLVIARRALECNLIDSKAYWDFYDNQQESWNNPSKQKSSGGDYYNTKLYQLSRNFSYSVILAEKYGQIMFTDASSLLGVSGKHFDTFSAKLTGGM